MKITGRTNGLRAEQVRSIFRFDLRFGATGEVARHLNVLSWERKRWLIKHGAP